MSALAVSRDLSRDECVERLGQVELGRLVFSANCLPTARPVHLDLVGDELRVTLSRDVDRTALKDGDVVALEIDDASSVAPATWIVTVTGKVLGTADPATSGVSKRSPGWAAAEGLPLLRLSLEQLDGYTTEPLP